MAKKPLIIAMKGHPGTGKSTLARKLSLTLRCPVLDKDDVRDATLPLADTVPPSALNDLSYSVLWHVTSTQLQQRLPFVVVDSPLSNRSHLEALVGVAGEAGGKVAVVECRTGDEAEWRRRVEERGRREGEWHRPRSWEELQRLVAGYGGRDVFEVDGVERLAVDTTGGNQEGLVEQVMEFVRRVAEQEQ